MSGLFKVIARRMLVPWMAAASTFCALPAAAQSSATVIEPAGGLTIEHLIIHEQGYAWVLFAESIPQVTSNCATVVAGNFVSQELIGRKVVHVNLQVSGSTTTGKQIYNTLLVAQQLGRKVKGFSFWNPASNWCEMFSVRIEP
jgi:hypothetical protein